jgi:hypothetical protein
MKPKNMKERERKEDENEHAEEKFRPFYRFRRICQKEFSGEGGARSKPGHQA